MSSFMPPLRLLPQALLLSTNHPNARNTKMTSSPDKNSFLSKNMKDLYDTQRDFMENPMCRSLRGEVECNNIPCYKLHPKSRSCYCVILQNRLSYFEFPFVSMTRSDNIQLHVIVGMNKMQGKLKDKESRFLVWW